MIFVANYDWYGKDDSGNRKYKKFTCQGLSLDCAIIDLSENVFSDGMAYVALSRVRSLLGLHLVAFNCDIQTCLCRLY